MSLGKPGRKMLRELSMKSVAMRRRVAPLLLCACIIAGYLALAWSFLERDGDTDPAFLRANDLYRSAQVACYDSIFVLTARFAAPVFELQMSLDGQFFDVRGMVSDSPAWTPHTVRCRWDSVTRRLISADVR